VFSDSLRSGTSSFASLSLMTQTNDLLVARDNKGDLHPALALRWETIDPLTMRFHLRQGVKFSDGVEFTADDVAFTINRVLDPAVAYAQAARISQVEKAVAVDKYTVDVKTKAVFPTLVRGLSDIIMEPKHYYEKVGPEKVAAHPIGTGPFIFKEWVPGDHYTLTANKDYWGGAPGRRLIIRTIPDGSTQIASLVTGEPDHEEVPIDLIDQVNSSGQRQGRQHQHHRRSGAHLRSHDQAVRQSQIREAFDYAIDKPLILKQILKGQGALLDGQVLTKEPWAGTPT
jgi:peptide/nickel transport system substrate-binding protein